MCVVTSTDHPIALKAGVDWSDLASLPWVVPPPWASSRIKLNQMFYKHGLNPPVDLIESASFLTILTFVRQRPAIGYLARGVARHFEAQGFLKILDLDIPIELPPVGIITMRGRIRTPTCARLIECLRQSIPQR
jgi:DNA-binding transcriptional LysR family regulator